MTKSTSRIVFGHPAFHGVETVFGYERDWFPDPHTWQAWGADWLPGVAAMIPTPDIRPANMTVSGGYPWTLITGGNTRFRNTSASADRAVEWVEFYDGGVYAAAQQVAATGWLLSPASVHNSIRPRFSLHLVRCSPPPEQGVAAGLVVALPCLRWEGGKWKRKGRLTLSLPYAVEGGASPFLHYIDEDAFGDRSEVGPGVLQQCGRIVSVGSRLQRGGGGGPERRSLLFEFLDDPARVSGTHILIRDASNMQEVWHAYLWDVRFDVGIGAWEIGVVGAVQILNVTPIAYGLPVGQSSWAYPRDPISLPVVNDSEWETEARWGACVTEAKGWSIGVATHEEDEGHNRFRPYVRFRRLVDNARHEPPVFWFATQSHFATIGETRTEDAWDTEGQKRLLSVEYTINREWRGASGSAKFGPSETALPDVVRENSVTEVHMGWEDSEAVGWARARVASPYVIAGGVLPVADGESRGGLPEVTVALGDFTVARMPHKRCTDRRQAGGRQFLEWAQSSCLALGLPLSKLWLHADLAARTIPAGVVPSEPAFQAPDGMRWDDHFDAVCEAMGCRWGFDKYTDGGLFFDFGPEVYSGTVSATFSYDTLTERETVYHLKHEQSKAGYTNFIKASAGRNTFYAVDALAKRIEFGDTWQTVLGARRFESPAQAALLAWLDANEWHDAIVYTGPLRIGLRPEMFVGIGSSAPPQTGLVAGSVYQVAEHKMIGAERFGLSVITGVLVYVPAE